jgi:CRP-like cAMP-binding protein
LLQGFGAFSKFSGREIRALLRLMRRWNLPHDTVVFTEDSPGGSCFIVIEGRIDVSIDAHRRQQFLATLEPGSIFGQVSLLAGVPRSATCTVRSDAVLLEIEREPCQRLLKSGSPTALKFLAALNEGLIAALRGADLRLMQVDQAAPPSSNRI